MVLGQRILVTVLGYPFSGVSLFLDLLVVPWLRANLSFFSVSPLKVSSEQIALLSSARLVLLPGCYPQQVKPFLDPSKFSACH